jgi:phage terminase large subunit-like protein
LGKKKQLRPFTVEHFVAWAKELELDTGGPWEVDDYFQWLLKDVFDGFPIFWLYVPEANAKTTNMSGLALYHCEYRDNAFAPWAASARDQAEIGYTQAKVFAQSMPKNRRPRCYDGYRRIVFPNGSRIQIFAAGEEHADGVIPTLPLIDEGHRHKNLGLYRTWVGKLRKRGGQLGLFSTAGKPGGEFEETKDKIIQAAIEVKREGAFARYATERIVLHEWKVRGDIHNMADVKAANPHMLVTEESLAEKYDDPTMTEEHWKRFTCCIPAETEGELFINLDDWNKCLDAHEIEEGAHVCIGADGSRTWDTTVVAWATALADHIDVDCRVFSVRPEAAHHILHEGGKVDFGDVEAFLIDLFDRYHPLATAYDPRYLERSMEIVDVRLPSTAVVPVEPQTKLARDAYQALFNAVLEGKLRHKGDPVIAAHLANCAVDRDERTREIRRLRKIDPRKPIDAVPALALAVWRATLAQPSVYEERQIVSV